MPHQGIKQAIAKARDVLIFLEALNDDQPVAGGFIDGLPLDRIEKLGPSAHRHLKHLEEHGGVLTQGDSIAIRRELYGSDVRSTANQFGTPSSGAILFRDVRSGQKVAASDPIKLTDTGMKLAKAYRQLHRL